MEWLLIYPAIFLLVLGTAIFLFWRANLTKRVYQCPNCHERIRVELMDASYCNVCGAPLKPLQDNEEYYDDP